MCLLNRIKTDCFTMNGTSGSAVTEGPRDAPCKLKSYVTVDGDSMGNIKSSLPARTSSDA